MPPPPPGPPQKFSFTNSSLAPPLENLLRGPCLDYNNFELDFEQDEIRNQSPAFSQTRN